VTDSEGTFTCCGLDPGPWTVEARLDLIPQDSYSNRQTKAASAASAAGRCCRRAGPVIAWLLDDGIAMTGSVVDDQGNSSATIRVARPTLREEPQLFDADGSLMT